MESQAVYHRALHDVLAAVNKDRHGEAREVFGLAWEHFELLGGVKVMTAVQLDYHLRAAVSRRLEGQGKSPVVLKVMVMLVVKQLVKVAEEDARAGKVFESS